MPASQLRAVNAVIAGMYVFPNGKDIPLIFQLSPKGSFGQRFTRVSATKRNVRLRHAVHDIAGMYWFLQGQKAPTSPRIGVKRACFSKGSAPSTFSDSPPGRLLCKRHWFYKGFAPPHSASVHVCAFRLLNAAHRHESVCFSKGSEPCVICHFRQGRVRCKMYWFS